MNQRNKQGIGGLVLRHTEFASVVKGVGCTLALDRETV